MSEGGAATEMALPNTAPACPDDTVLSGSPPGSVPADLALQGYAAQVAAEDAKIRGLLDELHEREMRRSVLLLEMERLQHKEGEAEVDGGSKRATERRRHASLSTAPSALDATFLDLGPEEADADRDDKEWPSMVQAASPTPGAAAGNPMGHFLDVSAMGLECREECADFLGAAQCRGCGERMPLERTAIEYHSRVCLARSVEQIRKRLPGGAARRPGQRKLSLLWGAPRPLQPMIPVVASPAQRGHPQTTPTERTPTEGMPAEVTPAEVTPAGGATAGGAPAEGTPAEGMPTGKMFAEAKPADATPAEGTPTQRTPAEPAPAEPAPAERAPAQRSSSKQVSRAVSAVGGA